MEQSALRTWVWHSCAAGYQFTEVTEFSEKATGLFGNPSRQRGNRTTYHNTRLPMSHTRSVIPRRHSPGSALCCEMWYWDWPWSQITMKWHEINNHDVVSCCWLSLVRTYTGGLCSLKPHTNLCTMLRLASDSSHTNIVQFITVSVSTIRDPILVNTVTADVLVSGCDNPMMTSSNGNIFRVTGPLWGESTGPRWIKGQWRGALMFSLICARISG